MPTEEELEAARENIRSHGIDPAVAELYFKSAKPCPRCGVLRMPTHACKNCGAKADPVPAYLRRLA